MEGWIAFWKFTIYGGVTIFALMSLWVIVAGYADIKHMFAALRDQRDSNSGDDLT